MNHEPAAALVLPDAALKMPLDRRKLRWANR
jgi:hypothetical protein